MPKNNTLDSSFDNVLEMEDGSKIRYEPLVEIRCAFCSMKASVVRFENDGVGVLHKTPECAEFTVMDPVTYLRENRKVFQREIDEGKFKAN